MWISVEDGQRLDQSLVDALKEGRVDQSVRQRRRIQPVDLGGLVLGRERKGVVVSGKGKEERRGTIVLDDVGEAERGIGVEVSERLNGFVLYATAVTGVLRVDEEAQHGRYGFLVSGHPVRLVDPVDGSRVPSCVRGVVEVDHYQWTTGTLTLDGWVAIYPAVSVVDPDHRPEAKGERLSEYALSGRIAVVRISARIAWRAWYLRSCTTSHFAACKGRAGGNGESASASPREVVHLSV